MSGVGLTYDLSGVAMLQKRVAAIGAIDREWLLEFIGATVQSQTRRRITDVKEAPDGSAWPKWSKRYAETLHSGKSFLEGEGFLLGSLTYEYSPTGHSVEVGSNMIYAATHQYGDAERNIPARPYLGLSSEDESDLEQVIDNFLLRVAP